MALSGASRRFQHLRLDTARDDAQHILEDDAVVHTDGHWKSHEDDVLGHRAAKLEPLDVVDDHSSTCPIPIGGPSGHHGPDRSRRTSVTFDTTLTLDSGERLLMPELLENSQKPGARGWSLLQPTVEQTAAHSQPCDISAPSQRGAMLIDSQANLGESGLQYHSQPDLCRSTIPGADQPRAIERGFRSFSNEPEPDRDASPPVAMPEMHPHSMEEPLTWRRKLDRSNTAAADFFSRAGSFRKSPMASSARNASRRSISSSNRSPKSAASSFLASFSGGRRSRPLNGPDGGESLAPEAEGQTIGDRYVLGKQIAFGGFSVIKEAVRMDADGSQSKVAVKIVRRNIQGKNEIDNERAQAEFDHEVELWRFLRHPYILPLESVYKTDEATFCFVPLIPGGTLFDAVRANRSGLPLPQAKRYSYQLAAAVRFLHEDARVTHRDIKLENCLVDTSVQPPMLRLCDFGMAEWISSDTMPALDPLSFSGGGAAPRSTPPSAHANETSASAFAGGSLEYAAPEIIRLAQESPVAELAADVEPGLVSPAGDMWALGVCVFTLLVGSRPFQDSFPPRVAMAILAGSCDYGKVVEKGGQDARDLVRGCLELDLPLRWDCNDVLHSRWLMDEAIEGGHDAAGGPSNPFSNPFSNPSLWGIP